MEVPPSSHLSPPAAAAPLADPVSMLTQPEAHARGKHISNKVPPGHRDTKGKGSLPHLEYYLTRRVHPSQKPPPPPHIPSARCLTQLVYSSPEPLPPAPRRPVTEERTCMFGKFLGRSDVMIPVPSPYFFLNVAPPLVCNFVAPCPTSYISSHVFVSATGLSLLVSPTCSLVASYVSRPR